MEPSQPVTNDPIGLTLASIGAGASAGGMVLITSTLIVRLIQSGQPDQTTAAVGIVLTAGLLLGMATAVTVAFRSSQAIVDLWRRAVTGAIAMFGAAIFSIVAMPLEIAAGVPGLAVFAVVLGSAFIAAKRIARKTLSS